MNNMVMMYAGIRDFLREESEMEVEDFTAEAAEYLSAIKDTIGAQTAFLVSDQSRSSIKEGVTSVVSSFTPILRNEGSQHDY